MKKSFLLFAALAAITTVASADVRLPKMFSSNAVLQRDAAVKVWGSADAGEEVTVEFNGQKVSAKACDAGKWCVELKPMAAKCEASDLVVTGKNAVKLENVVVGDVWVCSGQSNMEWRLGSQSGTEEEYNGDFGFIRFCRDPHVIADEPKDEIADGVWTVCKDGAQKGCTAVGFHFAVRLNKELGVPVGLIDCNWGGSCIETWMPKEAFDLLPKEMAEPILAATEARKHQGASRMYNAKLAPWTKYAIKGAIWYQGCSNGGEGLSYFLKQKAMIETWRKIWGYEFPFYWVQLANFTATSDDPNDRIGWGSVRDAQTKCLEVPKTGQAVIIDVGETGDIHPRNKYVPSNRLATWALAKEFGKDIVYASPTMTEVKLDGAKATVVFDQVGSGLVVGQQKDREFFKADGDLKRFAVAGEDGKYFWADAKIVGKDRVELSSKDVAVIKNVRYAWQQNPEGANLYNAEGFPATPFTTEQLQ